MQAIEITLDKTPSSDMPVVGVQNSDDVLRFECGCNDLSFVDVHEEDWKQVNVEYTPVAV